MGNICNSSTDEHNLKDLSNNTILKVRANGIPLEIIHSKR